MREGKDNQTDEGRGGWREVGMLNEIGINDGIKEVVIDGVVDMGVLVVVDPERSNN